MAHVVIHISSTRSIRFNGKVWSSNGNSFSRPITRSIWIPPLAIPFPTATYDGVSCLLLLTKGGILAVTLYCKNKSCTIKPLWNKTEQPGINRAAILVSSVINLSVAEPACASDI